MQETVDSLFKELKRVCDALESGKLSLEDSMKTFEHGVEIQRKLDTMLRDAERKVVEIIKPDGTVEPFTEKPSR